MADRTVTVGVNANTAGYDAALLRSAALTKKFALEGKTAAQQVSALEARSAASAASLDKIGRSAGGVGIVAAAGLGAVIGVAARFDKAMSAVDAATHESAANMDLLRQAAIKAGADTSFSASEAAAGIEELAKAGVSTADILSGGLRGALDLAAAGTISVADAAEYTATALNQFKLGGGEASHVADLLAAGAGKAQGSVADLALALDYAGVPASQLGVSIEETAGTLALFASNGILGSKAGTSLRGILSTLASPSDVAAKALEQYNIQLFDAQGKFIGLAGTAEQLHSNLSGLTQEERNNALGRIFSNAQLSAANVLYKNGAKAVTDWTDAVNQDGYASDTARRKLNNLSGDLEKLRGSLETALIGAGEGSQGELRGLVQGVTGVINAFSKLPPAVQGSLTGLLAITALTGGGVWLGARVIGKVTSLSDSLTLLGETSPKAAAGLRAMVKAGVAFGALTIAGDIIDTIHDKAVGAAPAVEALTTALLAENAAEFNQTFGAGLAESLDALDPSGINGIADSLNGLADKGGAAGHALELGLASFGGFGGDLEDVRVESDKAAQGFESLDAALSGLVSSGGPDRAREAFSGLAASQGLNAGEQKKLLSLLPGYKEALAGAANAAKLDAEANKEAGDAATKSGDAHKLSAEDVKKLRKAYQDEVKAAHDVADSFLDISKDADNAKVSLDKWIRQMSTQAAALENFTANAVKAGKRGLRDGLIKELETLGPVGALRMKQLANATDEEIGRANRAWKRGQKAANDYAHATVIKPAELKVNDGEIKKVDVARGKLIDYSKMTPTAQIRADSHQALGAIHGVTSSLASIPRFVESVIRIRTEHMDVRLGSPHAGGGLVSGAGSGTSDSILTPTSNGEFVEKASAVAKYGVAMLDSINDGTFRVSGGGSSSGGGGGGGQGSANPYGSDGGYAIVAKIIQSLLTSPLGPGKVRAFGKDLDDLQKLIREHNKHVAAHNAGIAKHNAAADAWNKKHPDAKEPHKHIKGGTTAELQGEVDAIKQAGHDLAKEIRQAEKERAKAIREAFKSFEDDLSAGAASIRTELGDLRRGLRDAGGVWNKALTEHAHRIMDLAQQYDVQATALEAQQSTLEALNATGADLANKWQSLSDQVAGNFTSDLFGHGLAGVFGTASKDTAQASMFQGVLQQLSGMGLDGPAFQALASSGDVKTATQLLNSGQVDAFEGALSSRTSALGSLGSFASDTVFGQQIADNNAQIAAQSALIASTQATLTNLQAAVDRQEATLRRLAGLDARVEQGAERGTRQGIESVGAQAGRSRNRNGGGWA
jgi:TP901 family phage tail tape measure protein